MTGFPVLFVFLGRISLSCLSIQDAGSTCSFIYLGRFSLQNESSCPVYLLRTNLPVLFIYLGRQFFLFFYLFRTVLLVLFIFLGRISQSCFYSQDGSPCLSYHHRTNILSCVSLQDGSLLLCISPGRISCPVYLSMADLLFCVSLQDGSPVLFISPGRICCPVYL